VLAPIATTILLLAPCHDSGSCYDYSTRTVRLNSFEPYTVTHELGHAFYFDALDDAARRDVAVGDPHVRNEEAFADVFSACVLGRGPRWLASTGYRVRVGPARFWRICGAIRSWPTGSSK
jgi:hypothetical protein